MSKYSQQNLTSFGDIMEKLFKEIPGKQKRATCGKVLDGGKLKIIEIMEKSTEGQYYLSYL